jgi:pSer/pThr/pTyr-binding forkhead associated (FHA) protein
LHLAPKTVSRRHLRLRLVQDGLLVEDLDSTHGTYVDGQRLQPFAPIVVQRGQSIRIAGLDFRLELDE